MKRRNFVVSSTSAISSLFLSGLPMMGKDRPHFEKENGSAKKKVLARIGICADVHQDVMPDGERRIKAFIDEMKIQKPDFIIQLGDFCGPYEKNRHFVEIWQDFPGPSFHVIGNYDADGGFSFQDVIDFWKTKGIYYSFDSKGYHFIVLNGNERSKDDKSRWPSHISETQHEWLKNDLEETNFPVILFCHQGIDIDVNGAIEQATRTRVILERANKKAGFNKVQLVFSGHHHQDYHNFINGIHYVQINSMSYFWMDSKYRQFRFSDTIDREYPLLKDTAPYKDSIWAFLTIYEDFRFEIRGMKTEFVSPSPMEIGFKEFERVYPVVPWISDRNMK